MKEFLNEVFRRPVVAAESKRIEYIDLAKGICIFLVVLLHMGVDFPLTDQIRMPLYFVLSGLFFKDYGVAGIIVKKLNKLMIPFLFFNIIGEVYLYFETKYLSTDTPVFEWAKVILFLKANGTIWFLQALFWNHIVFLAIYRLCKSDWQKVLAIIALSIAGLYLRRFGNLYYINTSLISLPFFVLGFFLRRTNILKPTRFDRLNKFIALALFCLMGCYIYFIEDAHIVFHLAENEGNILIAYCLSVLGVLGMSLLCKSIKWLPFFSYIGRYSIIVLCTHIYVVNAFVHVRQKFFGDELVPMIISVVLVYSVSLIMIPLCRKYIPHFVAQKDLIKQK